MVKENHCKVSVQAKGIDDRDIRKVIVIAECVDISVAAASTECINSSKF